MKQKRLTFPNEHETYAPGVLFGLFATEDDRKQALANTKADRRERGRMVNRKVQWNGV